MAESRLDILQALHRTAAALRADFAGVALGGLVLVSLPGLALDWLAPPGGWSPDMDTLATTLRVVLAMLYMALVSWGVLARLAGRPLSAPAFVREGVRRAQPGLKVALLAGAVVVIGLIIHLFARHGTTGGFMLEVALLSVALWGLCALMPVVPVALVERLGPVAALRRAAALTAGNRDRTLVIGLIAGLALAPSGVLVASLAGSAGPFAKALFDVCAWGLAGALPAVVYTGLRGAE